jgi:hypothetical protein
MSQFQSLDVAADVRRRTGEIKGIRLLTSAATSFHKGSKIASDNLLLLLP